MPLFSFLKKTAPTFLVFHDNGMHALQLAYRNNRFELSGSSSIELEADIVRDGSIVDMESFKLKLSELFEAATPNAIKTTELYVNIPYHMLFTFIEDTSHHVAEASLRKAMEDRIKKHSPVPFDELVVLYKDAEKGHATTSAAYAYPKKWEARVKKACSSVGVKNISFIAEPMAQISLLNEVLTGDYALFSCHRETISLSAFHNGLLYDSFKLSSIKEGDLDCESCFEEFKKTQKDFEIQFDSSFQSMYFVGFNTAQRKQITTFFEDQKDRIFFIDGKSSVLAQIMPYEDIMSLIFGMFNIVSRRYVEVSE